MTPTAGGGPSDAAVAVDQPALHTVAVGAAGKEPEEGLQDRGPSGKARFPELDVEAIMGRIDSSEVAEAYQRDRAEARSAAGSPASPTGPRGRSAWGSPESPRRCSSARGTSRT